MLLGGCCNCIIHVSLLSILAILSRMEFVVSGESLGLSLVAMKSAACPICDSNCKILLFLMSIPSFKRFISTSCWVIVLLHASRAVFWNSCSGFSVLTLEDLCLVDPVGNACCEGGFGGAGARGALAWGASCVVDLLVCEDILCWV